MKSFSTRQAKQCFGDIIAACKEEPVKITRYNQEVAIVMSPLVYRRLLAGCDAGRRSAMTHIVEELSTGNHRSYSRRMLAALRGASRH